MKRKRPRPLTTRQLEALTVIRNSLDSIGVAPSWMELGDALGIHPNAAGGLLRRMERRGAIYCKPFTTRGIEVLV